jgi:hypothetical protein
MKQMKFILGLLLAGSIGFSCSDKDDPKPSLTGFWKGKYGSVSSYPNSEYAFLFRGDGTVRVFTSIDTTKAGTFKAEGTYAILGSTITTNYKYISPGTGTNSTSAVVTSGLTFMEGTWGSGTNTTNGGKFFLYKE